MSVSQTRCTSGSVLPLDRMDTVKGWENVGVLNTAEKDCLEQLHNGHDATVSLARSLGPDAYGRVSYCPDWTVAQVFSHLGSGAEIGLAILDAGLNQRPGPDPIPIWDRWNARQPAEMVSDFIDTNSRYLEALDRVAATDSSTLRLPFHTFQIDLATHLTFRLTEQAIHTWDIRVAFQADAEIDADAALVLVDTYPVNLLGAWANPRAAEEIRPARIQVQMVEPDRTMIIDVGDVVEFHRGTLDDTDYTARITLPAPSVWVRLCTGRLDPAHTPNEVSSVGRPDLDGVRALCTPAS
jgi:uncharacterized protein (TIGR03083 family)